MYSLTEMAKRNSNTTLNYPTPSRAIQLALNPIEVEIDNQRNLCRVERKNGNYGGYMKEILTENLTERDDALLICEICEGITREACISSSGGQFCSCCEVRESKSSTTNKLVRKSFTKQRNPPKQTPNVAVRKMVSSLKCSCPLLERGCEWLGTLKDLETHLDTCDYVGDKCKLGCGVVLQRNELKVHEEEKCSQHIVKCEHCSKEFIFGVLTVHTEKCPKMQVSCELKCGKIVCREDMPQHLKQDCGLVEETCGLGCGTKLTRGELKIHMTDICVQREIPCKHCFNNFKSCEMYIHLEKCPKMKVLCELKCGKIVCREDIPQHLKQECGLVEEICELGCGTKLTRDELKIHVTDICIQREIPCKHCFNNFKFCEMYIHLEKCPKMQVSCELKCGKIMCREDMTEHLKQECGLVEEICELGCGTKLIRDELKIHVTDICIQREIPCEDCGELVKFCDMSMHREECPQMKVLCELKCGGVMCREDVTQHFKENCPEKEIACPFANYRCYEVTKRKDLDKHLEEKRAEHAELKLNALENVVAMLSEQINTLHSINDTTKLDWYIEDITEFIRTVHPPIREQVAGFRINILFEKQSISVSFGNKQGIYQTTIIAKLMISLYSKLKMRVIKRYKQDILKFQTDVEQEIACIPDSDIQEFSRIGATEGITLEMYIAVM